MRIDKRKNDELRNLEAQLGKTKGEGERGTELTVSEAKPSEKSIQSALKNAGYYNGPIDGKVGRKTKDAVGEFQKANGLKADGKVGKKTWKALSVYLNKSTEVANPSADSQAVTH